MPSNPWDLYDSQGPSPGDATRGSVVVLLIILLAIIAFTTLIGA